MKTGLKEYSGKIEGFGPVLTLKDAIKQHGDTGKKISYLKVSYKSSERTFNWTNFKLKNEPSNIHW